MKLNTERIHTIWHLTWPQCIMLLCQFVIGITDVWAGGRIGSEVQASIGLSPSGRANSSGREGMWGS